MKLTVIERLKLQNLLPEAGNFVTLKLIRKLRETLSFSEQEIAAIEFKNEWKCEECKTMKLNLQNPKCEKCGKYMTPAGRVNWDEVKALKVIKDVHIGKSMQALCQALVKKLSDEEALTEQTMSLYEKFVVEDEESEKC